MESSKSYLAFGKFRRHRPILLFRCARFGTQRLFDWKAIQKYRSSVVGENVARFNLQDARDLVVLATGNAYLQAIAGAARVETAQAQVETAKALYDKAVAQQQAGVAPAIDTLRAQVEYQSRQQQLIAATNDFAKQKMSLARIIGLASGQEFALADKSPYEPFPIPDLETSVAAGIFHCAPITKPRRIVWWPRSWSVALPGPDIFLPSTWREIMARSARARRRAPHL